MKKYKFLPSPATGRLTDDDTKRYFSRLGFAVFALALSSKLTNALLAFAYNFARDIFFVDFFANPAAVDFLNDNIVKSIASMLITIIGMYGVGIPVFLLVSKALPRVSPFKSKMSFGQLMGSFCVTTVMMAVGNYISNIILSIFYIFGIVSENSLETLVNETNPWIILAFGVIIIPILEELLFRKTVCKRILSLGEGYAIFVSAAIFSLMHGNFYQFAYAFLVGALFALIYVKTGRLIYTIILHIFVNFIGMIVTPWLNSLDIDALSKTVDGMLEGTIPNVYSPEFASMYIFSTYVTATLAMNIIGIILLAKALKKRKITFESGLLPPPKENKFSNIFFATGVAVAISFFVIIFTSTLIAPVLKAYLGGAA